MALWPPPPKKGGGGGTKLEAFKDLKKTFPPCLLGWLSAGVGAPWVEVPAPPFIRGSSSAATLTASKDADSPTAESRSRRSAAGSSENKDSYGICCSHILVHFFFFKYSFYLNEHG